MVELDGRQHTPLADAECTTCLEGLGYRLLRFWNSDVIENRDGVVETILAALLERTAP